MAVLEASKPNITNFMPNFSERFHVMHRAGEADDWAVAAHEVDEMRWLTGVVRYIDPKPPANCRRPAAVPVPQRA